MNTLDELSTYVSNTKRIERECVEDNVHHLINAIISTDVHDDSWYLSTTRTPFIKVIIDNNVIKVYFSGKSIKTVANDCVIILYDFNGLYFKVLIRDLYSRKSLTYNETVNTFPEMYTFQENAFEILENKDVWTFFVDREDMNSLL